MFTYPSHSQEFEAIWHEYFFKINELSLFNDTTVVNGILQSLSNLPIITACKFKLAMKNY
jgi:hypothetical protein